MNTSQNLAGDSLRRWMKQNNKTAGAVAKEVGSTANSVRNWCSGKKPRDKFAKPLATLVGWSWDSPPEAPSETSKAAPETTPKAPSRRPHKDDDRDRMAGLVLQQWMSKNGYTDRSLMSALGKDTRTTATVASWRKGSRPSGEALRNLETLTGWSWDNPPAPEIDVDSIESVLVSQYTLRNLLAQGGTIDLNDDRVRQSVQVALDQMDRAIVTREVSEGTMKLTHELFDFVMNHKNPELAYAMVVERWNVVHDPNVRSLLRRIYLRLTAPNNVHVNTPEA